MEHEVRIKINVLDLESRVKLLHEREDVSLRWG
jgi:hypothetical protein